MAKGDLPAVLAETLAYEGGYSANPKDPGNWTGGKVGVGKLLGTKSGIAAASYPKTRHQEPDRRGDRSDPPAGLLRRGTRRRFAGRRRPFGLRPWREQRSVAVRQRPSARRRRQGRLCYRRGDHRGREGGLAQASDQGPSPGASASSKASISGPPSVRGGRGVSLASRPPLCPGYRPRTSSRRTPRRSQHQCGAGGRCGRHRHRRRH